MLLNMVNRHIWHNYPKKYDGSEEKTEVQTTVVSLILNEYFGLNYVVVEIFYHVIPAK